MKLVEIAHTAGREFTARQSRSERRDAGQYMTPPSIARFMARRLVAGVTTRVVRILEPSAGAGILASAVVEALIALPSRPAHIDLLMFEKDPRLIPVLEDLASQMAQTCKGAGVVLDWVVRCEDFLLSDLAVNGQPIDSLLTIANPPFFKINKSTDPRAHHHAYAVYGQPNVYGLFMAACARLTAPNGRWCFIVPRSWMNGQYFQAVRQSMFRYLAIDSLHAFESRTDSFEADKVLQETAIIWASGRIATTSCPSISLTRSQGVSDLESAAYQMLAVEQVIANDESAIVSLPTKGTELLAGLRATLSSHGLKVSTGPVVAFRAQHFICEISKVDTVPLLWLQHVRQQQVCWPIQKKREHIRVCDLSAWMLVANEPMVLVRRFSPKEDHRRVTCAPYVDLLPSPLLGLENHLNYIRRPSGQMSAREVRGLAAFLSSSVVDAYFRSLAGSTQVNAAELRRLPVPSMAVIEYIGAHVSSNPDLIEIDNIVSHALASESLDRLAA